MKNKNLRKIAKIISEEIRNASYPSPDKESETHQLCEYDSEVSSKFKKMILSLSNYKNNLRIDVNDYNICIVSDDITSIKVNNKSSKLYNEENYLRIEINKKGFSLNHGYNKRSFYKDNNMYNDLIDDIKEITKKINSDNFSEIWNDVMKVSGVIRDSNLDDLLNG